MRLTELTTYRTPIQPNMCIVALGSDGGPAGLGESFWGAPAVEAYLHETAAPVLASLDDHSPAGTAAVLRPYAGSDGSGAEVRGNGAVDMALWDLLGHSSGQSVSRLLGGPMAESMRVYNTCAGYDYVKAEGVQASTNWGLPRVDAAVRPYDDLEGFLQQPAQLTRSLMDEGYTAMKVWPFDTAAERTRGQDISTADLRDAMRIVEAIRAEAGDAMDILIEMHSLWSLKAATRILKALEDIGPYWVEDPMRLDSVDAYQRLRERVDVPIAAGESLTGRRRFKPLLDAGALDVAIVDLGWTGGITEAVRIASLADTYGVSFAPHDCTGPISFAATTQVVGSQPNGLISETVRASQASWYAQIAAGLPVVSDGRVELSEASGLGVSLRDDFISRADTQVRTTTLV
ncbi:MAG: mandelate racemase/muconate lactonizing enzyme family protein [Chloroflexota bacterium]